MSKNINLVYFQNENIYCFFKTANNFNLSCKDIAEILYCEESLVLSQFSNTMKAFNQ